MHRFHNLFKKIFHNGQENNEENSRGRESPFVSFGLRGMCLDLCRDHTIIILPIVQFKYEIGVQFYAIYLNLSGITI